MFPASSKGGGMINAFPDTCKTPAPPAPFVPVPYPNMQQVSAAKSTASKVMICNKEAVSKSSNFSSTMGDEAGTLKGLVSPFSTSKAAYKNASGKVKVMNKPIETALKNLGHNGANPNAPPGAQLAPSQTKVIICG